MQQYSTYTWGKNLATLQGDAPVSEDGQELPQFLPGTLDSGSDGVTVTIVVTKHVTKVAEGWDHLDGNTI